MNIDELLNTMKGWITTKETVAPSRWTEIALSLNLLKDEEYKKLFILQQKVAQEKKELLGNGQSSIAAKIVVESTDLFREMKIQEAKLKTVDEQIKIAKAHGRLRSEELRGY